MVSELLSRWIGGIFPQVAPVIIADKLCMGLLDKHVMEWGEWKNYSTMVYNMYVLNDSEHKWGELH